MSKTKVETQITVTIGEQSFELTLTEAKNLKAQLESAIPGMEIKWPTPIERPAPIFIPVPMRDHWMERRERERYRQDQITCLSDRRAFTQSYGTKMLAQ